MHRLIVRLVSSQVLQGAINCVFETCTYDVGGAHTFRDKLAHLKAVDALRERTVDLIGTHDGLRSPDCRREGRRHGFTAWGTELVESDLRAKAEQAGLIQIASLILILRYSVAFLSRLQTDGTRVDPIQTPNASQSLSRDRLSSPLDSCYH